MREVIGFKMKRGRYADSALIGIIIFCLLILPFVGAADSEQTGQSFSINSVLIKASVVKGEEVNKTISVGRGTGQQINLEVENIPGVSLSEESFVLNSEETKNIIVTFNSKELEPGVYSGRVQISDDGSYSYVPLILEVESQDVFYDANLDIPPKYSTINAGGQLVAQVKIFDLTWGGITQGLGANSVDIDYEVYDLRGNVISSQSENLVVDKQVLINKNVDFPKEMEKGEYVFAVIIRYKSSIGTSSQLFKINGEVSKNGAFFKGTGVDSDFALLVGLVLIFFLVIIGVFVYIIHGRDKMLVELQRYNSNDFTRRKEFILEQQKALLRKRKNNKPNFEKEIKNEVSKKLESLKKHYAKRKSEAEKAAKKGDKIQMKKMLESWKKKGYNTSGMEYKLKGLSNKEMKEVLSSWKNKYGGAGEEYKNRR